MVNCIDCLLPNECECKCQVCTNARKNLNNILQVRKCKVCYATEFLITKDFDATWEICTNCLDIINNPDPRD